MGRHWHSAWCSLPGLLAAVASLLYANHTPAQCQLAKFTENREIRNAVLGIAVSVEGTTALIGSARHTRTYVYEWDGASWVKSAELLFDGELPGFGRDVDLDGSRALIASCPLIGGFIFERTGGGWSLEAELYRTGGHEGDVFGSSCALAGDVAVIGADNDGDNGYCAGAAYVFERQPDGEWLQTAKLLASDGLFGDDFGSAVAVSGDVVVVAADDADQLGFASGAVYVFEKQAEGAWEETARLLPTHGSFWSRFGSGVVIAGDRIVIGAEGDSAAAPGGGAVYVFERIGDDWLEAAKFAPHDVANSDSFGDSVAIHDDRIIVGAPNYDNGAESTGAAYIFLRNQLGIWEETHRLTVEDAAPYDELGQAVALTERFAVVGAPLADIDAIDSGAAYVFATIASGLCDCLGDLDEDGSVSQYDLGILLASFGLPPGDPHYDPRADINSDGAVDAADLAHILARYGQDCER